MSLVKETRKLRAILHADVSGYSRLMSEDETYTVRTLKEYRKLFSNNIEKHGGRVVNAPGDSILAEFPSVVSAVQCAAEIQEQLSTKNTDLPDNRRMEFRIGINLGDVIQSEDAIYGDGINIAARIEALAEPGGVTISRAVFDHTYKKLNYGFEYQGEHQVKSITEPVRVYRVLLDPVDAGKMIGIKSKSSANKWVWPTIVLASIFLSIFSYQLYQKYSALDFEPTAMEKMAFPVPDKPSIAVLPFNNLSGDPKQGYFSDGITENIIMALSKTPKLFVIARNSTFVYKDKPVNIKQVAGELGVRYILEGSLQKTESRVRITVQLIDANTERHLWAERYDRDLKDIFALQDEITLEIITALQVELTEGEQSRVHRGRTANLQAFLKILKGREHHFRFTKEDMAIAKRAYKEAISMDPEYAEAYFWLAYAIDAELTIGWSKFRQKDIERLHKLSKMILALDDSSAQAHIVLSRYYSYTGQLDRAVSEAEKAVDLDPNDADGYAFGGLVLNQTKRYKEAIPWLLAAIRQNPSPPVWYLSQLGVAYIGSGNLEEASPILKKAVSIAPVAGIQALYCHTLSMLGKHEEALAVMQKAIERHESHEFHNMKLSHLGEYYRRTGRYEEAIDTARWLLDSNPSNKHTLRAYVTMINTYGALGKEEEAREAAGKALQLKPDFSLERIIIEDSYFGLSFYDWFFKDETEKKRLVNIFNKAASN